MKRREADVPYCGVSEEKIKTAKPKIRKEMFERYCYYQKERTEIYRKKEILKLPPPWSDNPMFRNFKFTMTKRWLDRESKNLINGILTRDDISIENKILNAVSFRMINKWKVFEVLPGNYIDYSKNWTEEEFDKIKQIVKDNGLTGFFTDAYFISGTLRALRLAVYKKDANIPKGESNPLDSLIIIFKFILKNKEEILKAAFSDTPKGVVEDGLEKIYGLGKFLAYQSFVDFTYIPDYKFSETEYVKAGPGAERGLKHLFEDFDGLNYAEAIFWLRDNIERLAKEYGQEWDPEKWFDFLPPENRVWTVMDIQNSMCEFDKTTRIWDEELQAANGKRVRKYNGRPEIKCLDDF